MEGAPGSGNRLGKSKEMFEEQKSIWFERSGPRQHDIREAGRMDDEALIIHTENLGYRPKQRGCTGWRDLARGLACTGLHRWNTLLGWSVKDGTIDRRFMSHPKFIW